jgi:hypothetical protein
MPNVLKIIMSRPTKLLSVKRESHNGKEFAARFQMSNGREKLVRFGTSSNYVSNPKKSVADRAAYVARHRVRENFNAPTSRGALSRWLLWGDSRSLKTNTAAFRRRFNL